MRTEKKGLLPVVILHITAAVLLAALVLTAGGARGNFGRNALLIAEPNPQSGNGVNINSIEDFMDENRMLVTYEIRRQYEAYAVRASRAVTVIGTNSAYAGVTGYPFANGGFFTKGAFDAGAREAVLNERAAAALFGGGNISGSVFRLNGELWVVAGVMLDDADADNIYVPATSGLFDAASQSGAESGSTSGQTAADGSLAALLAGYGPADKSFAVGKLSDLGVNESSYAFINIGKATAALTEMAGVAVRFALTLILAVFAWFSAGAAYRAGRRADAPRRSYAAPPAGHNPGRNRANALKTAAFIILFACFAAAALALAKQISETCITWQEIPLVFLKASSGNGGFAGRIDALGDCQATVLALFAASAAASAAAALASSLKLAK